MTKARHNGENYVFSLLLGYKDAPEGIHVREGLYYNPYFPGGAIGMPKQLMDGGVEYPDGTPVTDDQIVGLLITLLFAGQHTSSISGACSSRFCVLRRSFAFFASCVVAASRCSFWHWLLRVLECVVCRTCLP